MKKQEWSGASMRQAVTRATQATEDAFNARHHSNGEPDVQLWSWQLLGGSLGTRPPSGGEPR